DLHAVGVDDDTTSCLSQLLGQRRLAAGRRPGYQDRVDVLHKACHMAYVATLSAHPSNPVLYTALAEKAAEAVKTSGLYWLADGVAGDIALHDDQDITAAEAAFRTLIADAPIDVVVQRTETRRKQFLIADMDSTMIGQECIDEL